MIDVLIIRKRPRTIIKKNIGRIFREHNIVEYKSPEDNLTVSAYFKSLAYLYLYASLNKVDIRAMTLTLAVSSHPKKLLKYLCRSKNLTVEKVSDGIYYVTDACVAVQIVETKNLSSAENLWLSSLRRKLDIQALERLIDDGRRFQNEVSAYLYAVLQANHDVLKGGILTMTLADRLLSFPEFRELLDQRGVGDIRDAYRKIEESDRKAEEAEQRAEKATQDRLKSISRMLSDGESYEKIATWMLMPVEEVMKIDKSMNKALVQ